MRQSLNFNHLECFFSVANTLSFSATSKELGIAQPAVSKQVKSLEEYFENQLFIRSRQKVTLTTFGKELYKSLHPLYCELFDRVGEILDGSQRLEGNLKIGSLNEVGEKVFVPIVSDFKKEHPNINLEMDLLKSHEIIEKVKSGELQVGIIGEEVLRENIRCYKVLDEEIVLVTSKKNYTSKKVNLRELSYIAYRKDDPVLHQFLIKNAPHTKLHKLQIELTVNSHRSMVNLLKEHSYYAVMPKLSISKEIKEGTLKVIKGLSLKSHLYLIYQDVEYVDRLVALLIEFLKERLKKIKV